MSSNDCLFCRIVAGEIPATVVGETEDLYAFRDINPQAPTHILVIPKNHYADVGSLAAVHPEMVGAIADYAQTLADDECDGQFRLIFNSGPVAGQTVFHVHAHLLGGKELGWSPA